jgi:hypothetical protein
MKGACSWDEEKEMNVNPKMRHLHLITRQRLRSSMKQEKIQSPSNRPAHGFAGNPPVKTRKLFFLISAMAGIFAAIVIMFTTYRRR